MEYDDDDDDYERPGRGRSIARRAAKSFDVFALELIEVSPERCARFPVTPELLQCIKNVQQTKAKAARRRHLRALAGMLRKRPKEYEAIVAFLAGKAFTPVVGDEENRELERLRKALIAPETYDKALEESMLLWPSLDVLEAQKVCTELHVLLPQDRESTKAYRLLFKILRQAEEESTLEDSV